MYVFRLGETVRAGQKTVVQTWNKEPVLVERHAKKFDLVVDPEGNQLECLGEESQCQSNIDDIFKQGCKKPEN